MPKGYPHSDIPNVFVLAKSFIILTRLVRYLIGYQLASASIIVQLDAFVNKVVQVTFEPLFVNLAVLPWEMWPWRRHGVEPADQTPESLTLDCVG